MVAFRDYDWIVRHVEKGTFIRIESPIGYFAELGRDHIREFISDPTRETDGFRHGIFVLKVRLIYEGCSLRIFPLSATITNTSARALHRLRVAGVS